MARAMKLSFSGTHYTVGIQKVDRKKIYGYTVVEVKDDNGSKCELATITDDGKYILSKGCVGYTLLNEKNEYVATSSIKMLDVDGNAIEKIPSSFDVEKIELEKASLEDYLKLHVKLVYKLIPDNEGVDIKSLITILKAEKVMRFKFNYRADYDDDDAFLLQNNDTVFMVIGSISPFEFVGFEKVIEEISSNDDDDDFDFGML